MFETRKARRFRERQRSERPQRHVPRHTNASRDWQLREAARRGLAEQADLLLRDGANPLARRTSPLDHPFVHAYEAAGAGGHFDLLQALARHARGTTDTNARMAMALESACRHGQHLAVSFIAREFPGAMALPDAYGLTPMATALCHGRHKCVEALLGAGWLLKNEPHALNPILQSLSSFNYYNTSLNAYRAQAIKALLPLIDPDERDDHGNTILMLAARNADGPYLVKALLPLLPDEVVFAANDKGESALEAALAGPDRFASANADAIRAEMALRERELLLAECAGHQSRRSLRL